MSKAFEDLNRMGYKAIDKVAAHLPEICLGVSITGSVGAVALSILGTAKANKDLEEFEIVREKKKNAVAEWAKEQQADRKAALEAAMKTCVAEYKEAKKEAVKKVALDYIPAVAVEAVSITAAVVGYKKQKNEIKRLLVDNAALTAAFQALNVFTNNYRSRVIAELGQDADDRFATGMEKVKIEEEVVDPKTGKKKKVKTEAYTIPQDPGIYARLLSTSKRFELDENWNIDTINSIQSIMNRRLKDRGFLFLNEVYREFGFPEVSYGHKLGWIYDPKNPNHPGDNYIEFRSKAIKKFDQASGRWYTDFLINFNFDGVIEDDVWKEKRGTQPDMMTPDGGERIVAGEFHPELAGQVPFRE